MRVMQKGGPADQDPLPAVHPHPLNGVTEEKLWVRTLYGETEHQQFVSAQGN